MKNYKNRKKNNKKVSKFVLWWRWPLIVLVLSFCLSLAFGVLSELALSNAAIAVSIVVIVVFIAISILTDMIGVAVTSADVHPFRSMASRKVRGAKEAISLIKNADRVASVSADVIGDICSILSGAAGATVAAALVRESMSNFATIVIASLVSAVIAALTIFGKALCKKYAMKHSVKIILALGKVFSIFHIQRKKKNKHNETKEDHETAIARETSDDVEPAKEQEKTENLPEETK